MDATRRAAGLVLIQSKYTELKEITVKYQRISDLYERWKAQHKSIEVNYTDENMETLIYHGLHALITHNLYMLDFWLGCCQYIKEDLQRAVQKEVRFRHQMERILKVHDALVEQAKAKGAEIHQLRLDLERG